MIGSLLSSKEIKMKTKRIILFLLLILVSFSSCAKPTEPIDQINSLLTKEDFWYTDLTAISPPNLNWIYLINGEKQKTLNLRKRSTQFDIVLGLTQFFLEVGHLTVSIFLFFFK